MKKLLILNPGSTSTKIAVYEDTNPLFTENIVHDSESLSKFETIAGQYEFRRDLVLDTLKAHGAESGLDAIVSRGGLLPPIESGAYEVNDDMVWQLRNKPVNEHASNLGAMIALDLSRSFCVPAYIYDGVTVDEMIPVAKITGHPEMQRLGIGHNLNMRAAGMRYAKEAGKKHSDLTFIIAHIGGGISVSLHHKGRIIDTVNDEEGPFSPERTGGLPSPQLLNLAFSGKYTKDSLKRELKSRGGLYAYFGTTDVRKVQDMIDSGDEKAKLIYEAMALNISKFICAQAALVKGRVDAILLTGGVAYSERFIGLIRDMVEFIAPVTVYPGENEMESLALGGLRVLRGEEKAKKFVAIRD